MADIKDIDFSSIKRLILVDTRQPGRIGNFSSVLERKDIEIHIYDHHPLLANDIKGNYENIQQIGATVSILTQIIKEKELEVSPDEATVMCLGIYEDTGSFTFSSTTEKDFLSAAFLLSKGANLDIISSLIAREMNIEQIGLLNDMFQAAEHYHIRGVDIVLTSISTENYVPDFAFLVHKMIKTENLNVVFALGLMGNKVYVVARSRTSDVDVGVIVGLLGGGGHQYAASANIKGKTLIQVEQDLLDILHRNIRSGKQAKELMSSPAIKAHADISCEEARNLLTRYNINALVITESVNGKEKLLGYIARQVISKAVYLNLSHAPIREYMTTEIGVVGPDSELPEIQQKIIDNKQRVLPVMDNDLIIGVITRTDLLNTLVQESQYASRNVPNPFKEEINARTRNIIRFMNERLSERLTDMLKMIGNVGSELGYGVYTVGGFVRDLFLYRKNEDIDIVIEGDGIAFAKKYAGLTGARIHAHQKFGTAVVIFPDGFKIDVASARIEHYRFPADLPTVEMSSIKLDLFRRDFTVNTLAIQLNPERFGTLIDFFSAQKDIKEKAIRVLHNLSFVEDPTRVFRAIRFEQRFGFTIGKLTSGLIKNAVKMDFLKQLSGKRFFHELCLILEEENPAPALIRLNDYDLLTIIHPDIILNEKLTSSFEAVQKVLAWYDFLFLKEGYMKWAVYFMMLIRECNPEASEEVCRKFEIAQRYTGIFCHDRFEADKTIFWLKEHIPLKNSELYRKLSVFKTEILLYMMAATKQEKLKEAISQYFTQLRHITASVTGKDLKKMGIAPGPVYREIMDAILDAKLNDKIKTRNDELNFVRHYIS